MGLMDKVKAQATVLADKAQTGMQQGQTKLAEMQVGKQEDHLLRELGAYVFLGERGRTPADSEAKVAAIVSQLDALEAGGTLVTVTPDPAAVPSGGAVPQAGAVPPTGAVPTSGDPGIPTASAPPPTAAAPPPPAPAAPPPPPAAAPPAGGAIPQSSDRLPGQ